MNIAQIENNISNLVKNLNTETFIYDLLLAYGLPQASITRLQKGNLNLSKRTGEISWKRKLLFRSELKKDLHLTVSEMVNEATNDQRFVIATDYKSLLAIDTKTNDKLDISIKELHKHFDFFLPWAGMEKSQHQDENPADVKAAEKMAKLFDEIKRDNPNNSPEFVHNLNVFLSRLLFCYFADDTNIFEKGQFLNAVSSHTQADGSDLGEYLDKLFAALNTPVKERKNLPSFLSAFPYVNGGLFKLGFKAPMFTRRSRQAVIDCGELDWSAINPDIFGSMMQAVVTPENRGGLGMHYTSVPNIMKVIKPLFLDELYEEFEKAKGSQKKLNDLLERIYKIKIFDPACGSGNFLIIAYKELRRLEMAIFKAGNTMPLSRNSLSQFYGIEIDDFAHEIAQLSLWLAEHQMNVEFYKEFGKTNPTLPLKESGHIVQGNACRIDWEEACRPNIAEEVFIIGNPPYLGSKYQNDEQKVDMDNVFGDRINCKNLDYIACWFYKAAKYIDNNSCEAAFVSTNSICQGEQVYELWSAIFSTGVSIKFAFQSFKWTNNAADNAAVIVVIVGLSKRKDIKKRIFTNKVSREVDNINAYLMSGPNWFVQKRNTPLSRFPSMYFGNQPNDGGGFIIDEAERIEILRSEPNLLPWIKKFYGSKEFINNIDRWCFWLKDAPIEVINNSPEIKRRIEIVKKHRLTSGRPATVELASAPTKFGFISHQNCDYIIMPSVSSERREYIPIGFLSGDVITSNLCLIVPKAELYVLGILSSRMHMEWVRLVGGRLKSDYRYSISICYNTFSFPALKEYLIEELKITSLRILTEREKHPEKTLAELYDPDKMPDGLREAHHQNDLAVERCYRSKPFTSDEERLEHLFNLYEQMIEEEKTRGTLFESETGTAKKAKKKRS